MVDARAVHVSWKNDRQCWIIVIGPQLRRNTHLEHKLNVSSDRSIITLLIINDFVAFYL